MGVGKRGGMGESGKLRGGRKVFWEPKLPLISWSVETGSCICRFTVRGRLSSNKRSLTGEKAGSKRKVRPSEGEKPLRFAGEQGMERRRGDWPKKKSRH